MSDTLGFDTVKFSNNISEILDFDYGDFMRIANTYLIDLSNDLQVLSDKNINLRIDKMQTYLQFKPNWNIELTKKMLALDKNFLDDLLQGHSQDWESAYYL